MAKAYAQILEINEDSTEQLIEKENTLFLPDNVKSFYNETVLWTAFKPASLGSKALKTQITKKIATSPPWFNHQMVALYGVRGDPERWEWNVGYVKQSHPSTREHTVRLYSEGRGRLGLEMRSRGSRGKRARRGCADGARADLPAQTARRHSRRSKG